MSDEDALKGADIKSGDEPSEPAHSPTTPEDEGGVGEGTGTGDAGPASGTTHSAGDEDDHTT